MDRALNLEKNETFQQEHKGFASEGQSNLASEQSDVKHHFIAFIVNENKQLIELDGLKKGPHIIEEGCEDVLRGSIKEIQKRLAAKDISEAMSMMTINSAN